MDRFRASELRKRLAIPETEYDFIESKPKVYVSAPAHESFDMDKVSLDNIYLSDDFIDETDIVMAKIDYYLRRIIGREYITKKVYDELYITISPLLFYNVNTIVSGEESVVADSPELEYYPEFIRIYVEIITIQDGKEKLELEGNGILATVNFNNFASKMRSSQYNIGYDNFYALARAIIEAGKEERIPEIRTDIFSEEDTKSYLEETGRRKSL